MAKTLSLSIPDALAVELLTKRTAAEWKGFLIQVMTDELRDIRRNAAEKAKPAVVEPDTSGMVATLV